MVKKILILTVIFYFLILLQSSFLIHFNFKGVVPNLILISVSLLSFFSAAGGNRNENLGIYASFIGGFFLDIFSNYLLGLSIALLLVITFFIKKSLHYLKERQEKYPVIYFLPLLFLSLVIYDLFLNLFFYFFYSSFQFNLGIAFFIKIIYNLFLGALVFYPVRSLIKLLNYGFFKTQ